MAEAIQLNLPLGEGGKESVEKIIKPLLEIEKERNLLPVNLTMREKIREDNEIKRLSIENNLRKSLGLDIFENYENFTDSDLDEISDKKDEIIWLFNGNYLKRDLVFVGEMLFQEIIKTNHTNI